MSVKREGDNLMDLLEEIVIAESKGNANNLLQPVVSQVNQTHNKAKHLLVEKLISKYTHHLYNQLPFRYSRTG